MNLFSQVVYDKCTNYQNQKSISIFQNKQELTATTSAWAGNEDIFYVALFDPARAFWVHIGLNRRTVEAGAGGDDWNDCCGDLGFDELDNWLENKG